jgi:prophage antirepressor-like protein
MSLEKRACPNHVLFQGRTARLLVLNESGLYKLVMRSDKPRRLKRQPRT